MSAFTGTWRLLRLVLRRERVPLPVWLAVLVGLVAANASAVTRLFEDDPVSAAAANAANVAARVFNGPASGTELGALVAAEVQIGVGLLLAVMSMLMAVRHTRGEEEAGRAELVGAAAVGRYARLTAALCAVVLANAAFTGSVTLVVYLYGLPFAGAAATGAAMGAVGVTFGAVGAVTAQVGATQRTANLLAVAGLGVAFLLRAIGDALGRVTDGGVVVVSAWPSWLSPLGWACQVRPFHQDNWQVFGLFAVLVGGLVAAAFHLAGRRDVGAGMVAPRPGPPRASARLLSPLGLAWRLQRVTLLGWLLGLAVLGFALGALGDSLDSEAVGGELSRLSDAESTFAELFIAFLIGLLAVAAGASVVQALLRMRAEETAGHLEPVLAAPVRRTHWLASHLVVATVGVTGTVAALGGSGSLGYGLVTGDWNTATGMLGAALAHVPAVLALAGPTVAGFGLFPRLVVPVAWAAVGVSLVMGRFGALLDLPQAVLNLSPFTHVPAVPAEEFTPLPLAVQLVVALGLAALGLFAFRRRDLAISG